MLAEALAAKAVGIRPQTAVIDVGMRVAFAGTRTEAFAIEGIPTLLASEQALQQIQGASARLLLGMALLLLQLLLDGRKYLGLYQRWDGDRDPVLRRDITDRACTAWLHRPVALRAQPRAPGAQARLAKRRGAFIGWVLQDAPHHTPIPDRLADAGHLASPGQAATDLTNRQAGLATSLILGHIAVPIGGPAQHINRSDVGCMPLAAPVPFDNL